MTIILDEPITVKTAVAVTADLLTVEIARDNSYVVDRETSCLRFFLSERDESGISVASKEVCIKLSEWPEELREDIKKLRDYLEVLGTISGDIPAGESLGDDLD